MFTLRQLLLPATGVTVIALNTLTAMAADIEIVTLTPETSDAPGASVVRTVEGASSTGPTDGETPTQMPGFPVTMGTHANFKPTRGLVFADLVGDERLEIIASSTDRKVYAWDLGGKAVPGFPVTLNNWAQRAPSVADLDGDGDLEIVQFTRGLTSGGRIYALDHEGEVLPGFPINVNNNNLAGAPTLADLDGDGTLEIIAGERSGSIGFLHVFNADGTAWEGEQWPHPLDHVPTGSAAVGDVDDDGALEIFYYSYQSMYLLNTDGTALPGWPKQIPGANFSYQSAALADLDGDGDLEIVVGAHQSAAGCYVFHHDGSGYPGWPKLVGTWTFCPPTVTDLENDGTLEILDGRAGFVSGPSSLFWVWNADGVVRPGFPFTQPTGGGSEGPLTVADIDGDGVKEIFADSNRMQDNQGWLWGVDAAGNDLPGFPLRPQGFTYLNGATIGDVDGDGDYELGVVTYLDLTAFVYLYDLTQSYGPACNDGWPIYHGHAERGGLYDPTCDCPEDLDQSGDVGFTDLLAVLANWGPCDGCAEDLDQSGEVGFTDLLAVLARWG
ncbi:MAG: VCBS repeat-containing protein, partial [Phycisphaerae bacterium]|nr:VCBS repeat-containing protein [Phycisphaerae bacterium]